MSGRVNACIFSQVIFAPFGVYNSTVAVLFLVLMVIYWLKISFVITDKLNPLIDYTVKVWDVEEEVCLCTLAGHGNRVYSLEVRCDSD